MSGTIDGVHNGQVVGVVCTGSLALETGLPLKGQMLHGKQKIETSPLAPAQEALKTNPELEF